MEQIMYNLTNPQKSIWLTEMYYSGLPINNICGRVIIKQEIDLTILNTAINHFIKNNDSFRFQITLQNENPVQYITDEENYTFDILPIKKESEIEIYAKKEVNTPFNILNSRLFNFKLFKLDSGFGGFIINTHHIISDAATLSILCSEIISNYSKLLKKEALPAKTYSYIDYIKSEQQYLKSTRFETDKNYWKKNLSTLPEIATFLPQKSQTDVDYASKRIEFKLDAELITKINQYCLHNHISIFNFLVGAYAVYFGQINNMKTFLLGTPVLNRTNFSEKHTTGMFINTSLLKIDLSKDITFSQFTKQLATDALSVFRHQKYNYQYILNDLRELDSSIPALYDIMLSFQITKATDNTIDIPYSTKWYETDYISNSLNIHFHDNDNTGNLLCEYDYQISKINKNEIEKMHYRILHIINQILENENISIFDIKIITPTEEDEILNVFNTASLDAIDNKDIIELFKEQVKKRPNKTALFFEGKRFSYIELDKLSDVLANYLHNFDLNYEDRIAIFLDKSAEMIISILAILKVHATFLPIDVEYPSDRIQYILKDANVKYAITNTNFNKKLLKYCQTICLDNISFEKNKTFKYKSVSNSTLAYVMYTSGSTGRPKGVMVEQKSIIRTVKNPNYISFSLNERILQTGSIVFDACTFEIWSALLNGFTLYILKKEYLLNPTYLENYLLKNKISILWLTGPLFNQLCDINPYIFSNIKYLLTGGDVLSTKHINKVMKVNPKLKVINGYGPTENTTFTCCFNIDKKYTNSIPIGFPISGTTCYVVSWTGTLQPIGIAGELWTGGIRFIERIFE